MNRLPSELEGEVTIRVVDDMPVTSPGFVIYDETGHYNVYLNGRYNHESNMQTADHELRHILNDDFFNDDDIHTVESRASRHWQSSPRVPLRAAPRRAARRRPRSRHAHRTFPGRQESS